MKIQNLNLYGTRLVSCRKVLVDFGNSKLTESRYFDSYKWKIDGFDDYGGSNSAIAKIVSQTENEYIEQTIFLNREGEGWNQTRREVYYMKKVADIDTIEEKEVALDYNTYERNLSDINRERLESLKTKIKTTLPELEVYDIGKYLAPTTYNRYCILHTNQGAHIMMVEANAIYKIRRF